MFDPRSPGYAGPARVRSEVRSSAASINLLLTLALIFSIGVVVTVVSIGMARAGSGILAKPDVFVSKAARLR